MLWFHKAIATTFGVGYAPKAPGTFGALMGVVIYYLLGLAFPEIGDDYLLLGLIVIFFILGVWSSNVLEEIWGKDPGRIVIDESVGIWISLLFVPFTLWYIVIAFVLFRFFDILKPLGIRKAESLDGGLGIMADDVVAGIYANLILQLIIFLDLLPK